MVKEDRRRFWLTFQKRNKSRLDIDRGPDGKDTVLRPHEANDRAGKPDRAELDRRMYHEMLDDRGVGSRNRRISEMFLQECLPILEQKGHDYTDQDDGLSNFYDVGKQLGKSALDVWAIYWLKHVYAILTFIRTGGLKSEPIESRFNDAINYLFLGRLILEREREAAAKTDQRIQSNDDPDLFGPIAVPLLVPSESGNSLPTPETMVAGGFGQRDHAEGS